MEHRNWSYFVYDPVRSPFKSLRPLRWMPSFVTSRRVFRRWLAKFVKVQLGFRGYFDLYNIPFRHIGLFDFTEKRSPLQPGGMNCGPNIFDFLQERAIAYHVSAPEKSEAANLAGLIRDVESERIDFGFLYWAGLDGLLHRVGNQSCEITPKLRAYERWIGQLLQVARKHYEEVRLYVFSDHGMANCDELLDLRSHIDSLGMKMAQDYIVVYDSTMARFWFFNERARQVITSALCNVPQGRIIPDSELLELRALFKDRYFGETIFLVKESVLIVPSHMGERPIRGMHGYHPAEKHSYAALLTNQLSIPNEIEAIPDMYKLMVRDADAAWAVNHRARREFSACVSGARTLASRG